MIEALKEKEFDVNNKEHILISLGDLLDRGDKPLECLNFVNSIPDDRKILIIGNHELLLEESIKRGYFLQHDYSNGTLSTVQLLTGFEEYSSSSYKQALDKVKDMKEYIKYKSSLVNFYETDKSMFVHGWIPCYNSDYICIKIEQPTDEDWKNATWINGMEAHHNGCILDNKTIYCGHYHTSYGNARFHNKGSEFDGDACFDPYIETGIVALDSCIHFSNKCNCYVLTEDEI